MKISLLLIPYYSKSSLEHIPRAHLSTLLLNSVKYLPGHHPTHTDTKTCAAYVEHAHSDQHMVLLGVVVIGMADVIARFVALVASV